MQKNTKPPIRHLLQPLLLAAASALALPALAQHNLTVVNFGGANGAAQKPISRPTKRPTSGRSPRWNTTASRPASRPWWKPRK